MKFATGMFMMCLGILTLLAGVILAFNNQTGAAVACLLIGFGLGFGAYLNTDVRS